MAEMDERNDKEILRGKVQKFLSEFEMSTKTEEDMSKVLSLLRNEILNVSQEKINKQIYIKLQTFINVCEDYANNRGMLERVKKESEEIRLYLDL